MLQREQSASVNSLDNTAVLQSPADSLQHVYHSVLDFLRRQYLVIAAAAATMIVLGVVYILTTPPSYTATADLMIDTKKVQLFQQQSMFSDLPMDAAMIESQVEILRSETIALAVIKKLNLVDDPEFIGGGGLIGAVLSGVMGLLAPSGPSSEAASAPQIVGAFQSHLKVERVGLTYIIAISFRSLNADRAAQIANAVAEAYIDDQLESKFQAARRAGNWLQERLHELRQQATTAERAVVDFKNTNNMVDAGGRTINEQQLAELNSQLVLAQSQTGEARARADRVQSILKSSSPEAAVDATVADTLKSDVINKLRSQYLELARRDADWSARYGANHLAVVNVRNQMRELQTSIRNELERIAQSYNSDLQIAKQREESVQKQLDQAVSQSQVTNQAQVKLRELEANAQSYQALYDNFLQRYMESVQQQSFPITEARVISAASKPRHPSNPRILRVLGFATLAGLAIGALGGAWREFADRGFRTRNQVEDILQTDCIALVPLVKVERKSNDSSFGRSGGEKRANNNEIGGKSGLPTPLTIPRSSGVYSMIRDAPLSAFAESIRSIKMAVDLSPTVNGGRIIGFTSSVPNEGKSTIAVSVAQLAAQTGARTLLIDCDLKNPVLTRSLSLKAPGGLLEVLRGQTDPEELIWQDFATGMKFLPAAAKARLSHSSEVLASPQTRKLFDHLRASYDYMFIDFPPLMPIVDVRAATHLVDGYVYVVDWGKTRIDHVEQALSSAKGVYEHLLGVVLNKVDLRSLGRYEGGGYYHHESYFQRYGYTE